jgi:hypothetical protein
MEYKVDNINEAFPILWHRMWSNDGIVVKQSRNGPVRMAVEPVTTIFTKPRERVLFDKVRDCNPFFHFFESIWMLAGRNEVAWLAKFNKHMMDFSDDGVTLVSSYGYRWKEVLPTIIEMLRKDPDTRRAYIPIFQQADCFLTGKDIPCNVGIAFYVVNGALNMSVFNRSNDMIYGAYGANVVHFSFLQEYVARALGLKVGYYAQISSNFHLYTEFDVTKRMIGKIAPGPKNLYEQDIKPCPVPVLEDASEIAAWQDDAAWFIDVFTMQAGLQPYLWKTQFFEQVAVPLYETWWTFRQKDTEAAMSILRLEMQPCDWSYAALQWIRNRLEASGEQP